MKQACHKKTDFDRRTVGGFTDMHIQTAQYHEHIHNDSEIPNHYYVSFTVSITKTKQMPPNVSR